MTSIKISQLNNLSTLSSSDFFPIVDSGSLTTYRTSLNVLGNFLSTGSFSGSFTGSFYGVLIPPIQSCSWASSSLVSNNSSASISSSWASSSISSSLASTVGINGTINYFPYWTSSVNSNLTPSSVLYQSGSVLDLNKGYPYFVESDPVAQCFDMNSTGSANYSIGGIHSTYPITSDSFIGCDHRYWSFVGGGTYFSGSYQFNSILTSPGFISSSFNKKWIRIAAVNQNNGLDPMPVNSCSFARGWMQRALDGHGKIRLIATTSLPSTASYQIIEFIPFFTAGGAGAEGIVLHSNDAHNIIQKIRLHNATDRDDLGNPTFNDPRMLIDVYMDNIFSNNTDFYIAAESYGNIKFVDIPTVDPLPLKDTGSTNSQTTILNINPGHYTNINNKSFILSGHNLGVGPYLSYSSGSYPNYTVEISGSLSAQSYSVGINSGIDASNLIVYDNDHSAFRQITSSRGIIIGNNSTAVTPGLGAGAPRAWAQFYRSASGFPASGDRVYILSSYNISSITYLGISTVARSASYVYDLFGPAVNWLVTFSSPLTTNNYMVMGMGGEEPNEVSFCTAYPFQNKTNTQFTLSFIQGSTDQSGMPEFDWVSFTVYHP